MNVSDSPGAPSIAAATPGPFTVLVIEDDGRIRELIHRHLEHKGFKVLSAYDGEDALSFLASYQGELHVVVADMRLPGRDGFAVVQSIRNDRPRVEPVYISGYPAVEGLVILPKPLDMSSLIAAVTTAAAHSSERQPTR